MNKLLRNADTVKKIITWRSKFSENFLEVGVIFLSAKIGKSIVRETNLMEPQKHEYHVPHFSLKEQGTELCSEGQYVGQGEGNDVNHMSSSHVR